MKRYSHNDLQNYIEIQKHNWYKLILVQKNA